jgi:hypothetical protein
MFNDSKPRVAMITTTKKNFNSPTLILSYLLLTSMICHNLNEVCLGCP